jgi:hypothetical protein
MKEQKNKSKRLTIGTLNFLSLAVLFVLSCTKEVKYESLPAEQKEFVISKKMLSLDSQYLYSSSQQNGSRSAADAFPFLSGDNKRVRLQLTKDSLDIIEEEKDSRFRDNQTNNKLVLSIPIEHVQFQCAKDRFGECTNKEESTSTIEWDQRDSIKLNMQSAVSGELQLLPLLSSAEFGENCYSNIGSKLVRSEITENSINFQVERTFKTNLDCIPDEIESLADLTISAVYHYSLVRLDTVLSKDYVTIQYPVSSVDESTFGFFSSTAIKLDVDNNHTDRSEKQIMNRWNPNRSEIVYYLSDEFAKPENKLLKDLTKQTVNSLNEGLSQAGVKFRINLKDPAGKIPGDIRNSMIVLVEDPVASSVIGYGPQTEDPVTGEIISARTIMFLGTIKKFIKYTYDEILREKQDLKWTQDKGTTSHSKLALSDKILAKMNSAKKTGLTFGLESINSKIKSILHPQKSGQKNTLPSAIAAVKTKENNSIVMENKLARIKAELTNTTRVKNEDYSSRDIKARVKYLQEAKNCAFAPTGDGVGQISQKLAEAFPDDAKPWTELTDAEKENAIAIILPEIWIPTLIHELGHNMGLRHNFEASEDKDNFLSKDELARIGVDHDIPFSSVMDYGNDLKTLPVLGKYDIAALKFGYKREVDVRSTEGETTTVSVDSTLEELMKVQEKNGVELVNYKYCTDEHVGINAGCKRFDLGTTYTEIVGNMIQDYELAYTKRNLRDGRSNMSLYDDLTYARRINGIFKDLRVMMEVRERISTRFDLPGDAPEWEEIEFLKDLKDATVLGGQFLTRVLLVPDKTCAIAMAADPNTLIAVERLDNIDSSLISCYDLKLNPAFAVVAEAGKSFNSKKDPNSTNNFMDQIDLRGIWIDKILAAKQLLNRQIGIFSMDHEIDSFLNVPEVRKDILVAVDGLLSNNVVGNVEFTLRDGSKTELEIPIELSDSQVINKPIHPFISRAMGLNTDGKTSLQKVVSQIVSTNAVDKTKKYVADTAIAQSVEVFRLPLITNDSIARNNITLDLDDAKLVALPSNKTALGAIKNLRITQILEAVDVKDLEKAIALRKAGKTKPPTDSSKEVKKAWTIDSLTMQMFLDDVIKSSEFYVKLLVDLPSAQ